MEPRVVCVSHAPGAGGRAVGRLVSAELGFRYVDQEIVSLAAAQVGVPVDLVAGAEERKPLLGRLLAEVAVNIANASPIGALALAGEAAATSDDFRILIQQTIRETASQGSVVIVAHAASLTLAGEPGVLRVLVTGSPEARAARLASELGGDARAAEKLVQEGDLARADYFRRFYDVKQELPGLYDVVVSTDTLTPEDAARMVLAACAR